MALQLQLIILLEESIKVTTHHLNNKVPDLTLIVYLTITPSAHFPAPFPYQLLQHGQFTYHEQVLS